MHTNELMHYGVLGMKWGVRRYQNKDGSLTKLGKKRADEGANLFFKYKGKNVGWKHPKAINRHETADKIAKDLYDEEKTAWDKYSKNRKQSAANVKKFVESKDYRNRKEQYVERFLDEYANATLKDLGMEITPKSKQYVEDLLRERQAYRGIV